MPSQQMTTGPALIEGVERMDAVMIEVTQRNFYAMKVDRGRNCYACGRFGHMA